MGIVGARAAIDEGDFAEPLGRLDDRQQRFPAFLRQPAMGGYAYRSLEYRVKIRRGVVPGKQPLPGGQGQEDGGLQQSLAEVRRQLGKPGAFLEPGQVIGGVGHGWGVGLVS